MTENIYMASISNFSINPLWLTFLNFQIKLHKLHKFSYLEIDPILESVRQLLYPYVQLPLPLNGIIKAYQAFG